MAKAAPKAGNQNETENELMKLIECTLCYSYPLRAMESACCSQIMCGKCVEDFKDRSSQQGSQCPCCRQESFTPVPVGGAMRKLINSISMPCENGCGQQVKIGNIDDHASLCSARMLECKFCKQSFNKEAFLNHLQLNHPQELIEFASVSKKPINPTFEAKKGVKIGTSGKFYCGGRLDFKCGCCDGYCGPTNGCNCSDCQSIDINVRSVGRGVYINSQGKESYRDSRQNSFFCGNFFGPRKCSASSNNVCRSCKGLNCAFAESRRFSKINYH